MLIFLVHSYLKIVALHFVLVVYVLIVKNM